MSIYRVQFLPYAKREFDKLPGAIKGRVWRAVHALAREPRPSGAQLLAGTRRPTWRIRIGDYRVLYEVHADSLIVLVVGAGHRRGVYRGRRISEIAAALDEADQDARNIGDILDRIPAAQDQRQPSPGAT